MKLKEEGNSLAESGKYKEALLKWELASIGEISPNLSAILFELRAQVHLELEETISAIKCAEKATKISPSYEYGWLTLGRAQLNLGEVSMAIESLEKVSLPEASEDLQMARKLLIQTSSKSNDNS